MPDDADWASDIAERERQALLDRHRRRLPPPAPPQQREPATLSRLMDDPKEGR